MSQNKVSSTQFISYYLPMYVPQTASCFHSHHSHHDISYNLSPASTLQITVSLGYFVANMPNAFIVKVNL